MTTPTWQIASVRATPDFACVNSRGNTILPQSQQIWDPNGNYIDGDGSLAPVTFRTPQSLAKYYAAITVVGTCAYPKSWQGQKYIISGWLKTTKILQSGIIPVPNNNSVNAVNLFLITPNPNSAAIIPFRCCGDFVWKIALATTPATSYGAAKTTRLELCWSRAVAPNGPTIPGSSTQKTRVNLSPGYPIALFRLFSPNPIDFSAISPSNILKWYISRAMTVIWNWPNADLRPRYDVSRGASSYGVSGLGGSFRLTDWMNKKFPTLNCYDLAGISQLACAILVDQNGAELVDSHWIWQDPNGYVNPGPLYGWNKVQDGKKHMACNNPFWGNPANYPRPDAPRFDSKRSGFGNHAWVEIGSGVPVVLDACHASTANPYPDAGTRTRVAYLAGTLDDKKTPRGNAENKQGSSGPGNCHLNPYYQLKRVGVYDANGFSSARFFSSMIPVIPDSLRADLEETLERGKSSQASDPFFNTASVHPDTLIPLLSLESDLGHQTTNISVQHNATRLNLNFKHPEPSNVEAIDITIDIFDSFEDAINALTLHLLSFQALPLSSIISPLETPLGDFSYQTAGSIFWVRGNQFIHIQEIKTDPIIPSEPSALYQIATKLDEHLVPRIGHSDTGVPRVSLDDSNLQSHIRRGQCFNIPLEEGSTLLKTKQVYCDNPNILLSSGPASESGELELFALAPGKTKVRVYVADAVTLRPGEVTFEIEVESGSGSESESESEEVDTGVLMELVDTEDAPPV